MSWDSFFFGSVPGYNDSGLWNNNYSYEVPSTSSTASEIAGSGADPFGFVGGLWNDLTGITAQQLEFQQQEYLQDKQNEYDLPINQMQRLADAGINKNLAAAGIAGVGGSSSAQPAQVSASASPAAGLSSVASMLGSVTDVGLKQSETAKNAADARNVDKHTENIDWLAQAQVMSMIGDAASKLTAAGIPEVQAVMTAMKFVRGGLDEMFGVLNADGICRHMDFVDAEVEARTNLENKRFEQVIHEIWRTDSEKNLFDIQAHLTQVKKEHEEILKSIDSYREKEYSRYDGDPYMSSFQLLNTIRKQYGVNSPEYKAVLDMAHDWSYWSEMGKQKGVESYAFELAYDQAQANLMAKLEEMAKNLEFQKELTKYGITQQLWKELIKKALGFGTQVSVSRKGASVTNADVH